MINWFKNKPFYKNVEAYLPLNKIKISFKGFFFFYILLFKLKTSLVNSRHKIIDILYFQE